MMLCLGRTHAGNLLIGNSNYNERFVIRYLGRAAHAQMCTKTYWLRKDIQKYLICPKQLWRPWVFFTTWKGGRAVKESNRWGVLPSYWLAAITVLMDLQSEARWSPSPRLQALLFVQFVLWCHPAAPARPVSLISGSLTACTPIHWITIPYEFPQARILEPSITFTQQTCFVGQPQKRKGNWIPPPHPEALTSRWSWGRDINYRSLTSVAPVSVK